MCKNILSATAVLAIAGGLYLTSLYDYLLFHSLVEIFSIGVALALFMIAWGARKHQGAGFITFIGIAYLFVGLLDLLHTLAYKGMPIFTDYDYYANQLWIAARFLESVSLLAAFWWLLPGRKLNPFLVFSAYLLATLLLVGSIFVWKLFPVCFVDGFGQTPFKKGSEYVICVILVVALALTVRYRKKFDAELFRYLAWAIIFTIAAEISFTIYVSNYGFANLVGHYFKLVSFYLIYKAIVETCMTRPFRILFRDLKQSEENLSEAQRITHLGSWTYQIDRDELHWSDEIYRIFGLQPREFGATYEAFLNAVHPADRQAVNDSHHGALRNEAPHDIQHRIVLPDGRVRMVRELAEVFFDEAGRPVRMVGTVQDITDRRAAEEALATRLRYEKGLTDCSRALLRADSDSDEAVSRCLRFLLEASAVSRVYFFENFIDPTDGLCMRQRLEVCADGVTAEIDNPELQHLPYLPGFARWQEALSRGNEVSGLVADFPDGERQLLEPQQILSMLVLPVFVGDLWHGFIGFDDTEVGRQWQEEDIRLLWMTAEMIGGFLTLRQVQRQLIAAKEEAEAANSTKGMFLANMSHEIRTPMSAIIGMNRLALETELSQQQRHYLKTVQDSATSLLGLLNDILDLSKIEAGQLAMDSVPFDLRETMESTVRLLAGRAHEKGLEIYCHLPPEVPTGLVGDPMRLRQILLNLIGNAVKFTDSGEVVVGAAVHGLEEEAVEIHCTVADTGVGIAAGEQERIFERFTQADGGVNRLHAGTGLGLTICRRLSEMMGGTIWVESTPGVGSTFHFRLRFERGSGEEERRVLSGTPASPVLIVDPQPLGRQILRETFAGWGCVVEEAAGGPEAAVALAGARRQGLAHGLVVLNWQLVVRDGLEPATLFGGEPMARPLVIALLATGDRISCSDCGGLGIDFCLTRPVSREELRGVVAAAVAGTGCPARGPGAPASAAEKNIATWQPLRLLLAEDTPANRELAKIILEGAGHAVTGVANGLEALEALASADYDAVIMDVQMPRMDGLSATAIVRQCEQDGGDEIDGSPGLAARLRQRLAGGRIPILAMTAHAMRGDRERCLATGMDGYITKPFQPQETLAILEGHAHGRGRVSARQHARGPAERAEPLAPATVALAREHLLHSYSLPPEKIDFLLEATKSQVAERLTWAEQALAREDGDGLAAAAHGLVGVLANLGFNEWSQLARQVEKSGRGEGESARAQERLARLRQGLTPLM